MVKMSHLKYRILWDDLTKIDQYEGVQADETSFDLNETVLATPEYGHLGQIHSLSAKQWQRFVVVLGSG